MDFITESIGVQEFSDEHFRLCVFAFDLAHVIAAYFFGVDVCHSSKLNQLFTFYLSLFLLKEKVTKKLKETCFAFSFALMHSSTQKKQKISRICCCFLKVLMRSLR